MHVEWARRPVVAGVDGSASARRAVTWAAAEAARRGTGLRLVTAFRVAGAPPSATPDTAERLRAEQTAAARRELAAAVAAAG